MTSPLVYIGTVKSTKDEDGLGRIQVTLEGFPTSLDLPWIRMLSPAASAKTGFVFLPEVGDEVAVLRTSDDWVEGLLVLGSVYNGKNKPNYSNADGDNITKEIRTKAGNSIVINDKSGETAIILTTAKGKVTISMSDKDTAITLDGDQKVIIKGQASVSIEAQKIELKAQTEVAISAGGGSIKVSSSKVEVAAPMINLG